MTPSNREKYREQYGEDLPDNKSLIRQVLDKQDRMIEKQNELNMELAKFYYVVYGNPDADLPGLVGDNKKNKKFIEAQKKINWTFGGIFAAVVALKEFIIPK